MAHANKQDKTVEATHAATYEDALKEAAPDAPPSVGDAAAALKDATLRELGAAREKASTKIKAAARAARRNAPAWRRVGRWALGLLALAVVFAEASSSASRRPPIGRHVRTGRRHGAAVGQCSRQPRAADQRAGQRTFCGRVFY